MELKDQIYLIAKHYLSHQVNNTLLKENWRNVDYDRRYLTYLKDYEQLRKILDEKPFSEVEFIEIIGKLTKKQNAELRQKLLDLLLFDLQNEFKLDSKKIIEISDRLKRIDGDPPPTEILVEMRRIVEEMYRKGQ